VLWLNFGLLNSPALRAWVNAPTSGICVRLIALPQAPRAVCRTVIRTVRLAQSAAIHSLWVVHRADFRAPPAKLAGRYTPSRRNESRRHSLSAGFLSVIVPVKMLQHRYKGSEVAPYHAGAPMLFFGLSPKSQYGESSAAYVGFEILKAGAGDSHMALCE
jgi:hypothetical protein